MQENRSFDHYFGTRPGVRGFADPDVARRPDGRPIWFQDTSLHPDGYLLPYHLDPTHSSTGCDGTDPLHGWFPQHLFWADGALTGFAAVSTINMGYFTAEDVPYLHALADEFTLCDHSFCSVLGPTTPNRLYSMSATIDPAGRSGGPAFENFTGPFRWTTYPERLTRAGVSWRVYQEEDDFDDNCLEFFSAFRGLSPGDPHYDAAVRPRPAGTFEADVAAGNLPQVSWIVAPTGESEHPSVGSPLRGIAYTSRILGALMANPDVWRRTVFILTYDENGGWFDHVVPPAPPPGTPGEFVGSAPIGLGFRVPTIVASPWSTGGRVDSTVYDHTSVLQFLESRFGVEVPNLSQWRRETCGNLADALDLSRTVLDVPALPDTSGYAAQAAACSALPALDPPRVQQLPVVG